MKNIQYSVLSVLVERNHNKPDGFNPKGKNHTCTAGFHCTYVSCASCPFSLMNDPHKVVTMGDLRKELQKRRLVVTESHKGGGAGIYVTGKSEPIEFIKTRTGFGTDVDTAVYHPKHYEVIDEVEAIQVIARGMTVEQFKGYCLGNILKYRLRLGSKDAVEQDLKKAQNYKDIFEKFKGLCHDAAK